MAWIYDVGVGKNYTDFGPEQTNNAMEFYYFFHAKGFTTQSICGMLGNITWESRLNPGNKQTSSTLSGWGLIQWTPSTVLTKWCDRVRLNWYDGAAQCERIDAEGQGIAGAGGYWLPTTQYPYTWQQFSALTDINEATKAYLYERERAGSEHLADRLNYATQWYTIITGQPTPPIPPQPTPPTPYKRLRGMPVYMMIRREMLYSR